uniref:Uncharacterized protein n=1 Tax=Lotharella oceanica TaxID=641309 RepID=A0A7S2TPR2_9EUKA|mmetsp:Transcript_24283/g.45443  ORF Transcript_24283/g.45443 Transcript_24283/m.45443 type:complete len:168 (+) Transcript_24283:1-504(+)
MGVKNVTEARKHFGYAAAIAFIDGNPDKRTRAYTKLALSYMSIDIDSEMDLSGAMHMFWRLIRERGNTTIMMNQAQLLGQYSGVPKVSIIATLLRQGLHQLEKEGRETGKLDVEGAAHAFYRLRDLLLVSGRSDEAEALEDELPGIAAALEVANIEEKTRGAMRILL